jgi:hypothetical protein
MWKVSRLGQVLIFGNQQSGTQFARTKEEQAAIMRAKQQAGTSLTLKPRHLHIICLFACAKLFQIALKTVFVDLRCVKRKRRRPVPSKSPLYLPPIAKDRSERDRTLDKLHDFDHNFDMGVLGFGVMGGRLG